MDGKKEKNNKRIVTSIKAGGTGVVLSMMLLLPGAALGYSGSIELENIKIITWMTICAGTLLGQLIYRRKQKGRGVLKEILLAEGTFTGIVLVLSAGLPGAHMEWTTIFPVIVGSLCGTVLGVLIKINKTYNRKNRI